MSLYCLDAVVSLGSARPDRLVHLITIRDHVGHFIAQLAAPGQTAGLALLCGLGAIAIGVAIVAGTLHSSRPRLAILEADRERGTLAARPRVLGEMARCLAERTEGVTRVRRPRLSFSRRRRRGRLTLRGERTRTSDPQGVRQSLTDSVAPISEPFHLKPRARVRVAQPGSRAQ